MELVAQASALSSEHELTVEAVCSSLHTSRLAVEGVETSRPFN